MRDDVREFKRALIIRMAADLFFAQGYARTKLDDLAERLSMSKASIYDHFTGKTQILSTICERSVEMSLDLVQRVAATPLDPVGKIAAVAHGFTGVVLDNQQHIAIHAREQSHLPDDSRIRINEMQRAFDGILTGIIADGIADGSLRVADVRVTALALAGMIIWAHSWYRPDGRIAPARIAEGMVRNALAMVGAEAEADQVLAQLRFTGLV
jgi:AcrR family transcriptional regulator